MTGAALSGDEEESAALEGGAPRLVSFGRFRRQRQ